MVVCEVEVVALVEVVGGDVTVELFVVMVIVGVVSSAK